MTARLALPAAVLAVALLHAVTFAFDLPPLLGADRILAGPDCYMRLMLTERLWETGQWFDRLSPLTNAPHGEVLHWTRPFDLVLLAGALPLSLFMDMREALYQWGALVSPALHLLAVVVLWWGTRRLLPAWAFVLAAVLFYLQPAVRSYFLPGRPDHHGLQILLFVVAMAGLLRMFQEPDRRWLAVLLGLCGGLGMWVSVEGLIPVFVVLATLGVLWLLHGGRYLRAIAEYLGASALTVAAALLLDRPPSGLFAIEYDRISIVHVTLFVAMAAPWTAMRALPAIGPIGRTGLCLAGAAIPGIVMAALFPKFFGGPFVDVDPRMIPLWLEGISEVEPLLGAKLVFHLGPLVVALPFAARLLKTRRDTAVLFLVAMMVMLPMALYQVRWAVYVQTVMVIPWAMAMAAVLRWEGRWRHIPLRVPVFLAFLLGHLLVAGGMERLAEDEPAPKVGETCEWARIEKILGDLATKRGRRLTIVSFVHQGPEIAWRTGQAVVGSPYQRNADGVVDTHAILGATDMVSARAVVARRGVDVIAVCRDVKEARRYSDNTLFARLLDGRPPSWLRPVPVPEKSFAVMEVLD